MPELAGNTQPIRAVNPKAAIEHRKQLAPNAADEFVIDGERDIVDDTLVRH